MKLIEPKIKYTELTKIVEDINYNSLYEKQELYLDKQIEFNECKFIDCKLNNSILTKSSFIDCVLINCDLSNIDFSFSTFMRVEFRECKLVGANFIATSLQNVLFENCFASYINLSSSKLKKVIIQECDFSNASLVETKIDGGYLDIGIIDTMQDLFVNFIGAVCFSFIGFLYIKNRDEYKFAENFIPKLRK